MCAVEVVSPGDTQDVRQVESEVDESPAGSWQVGLWKEGADEETLHDGGGGKSCEEEKNNGWVAVRQDVAPLQKNQNMLVITRNYKTL